MKEDTIRYDKRV